MKYNNSSQENGLNHLKLNEAATLLMQMDKDDLSDLLSLKDTLMSCADDNALQKFSKEAVLEAVKIIDLVINDHTLFNDEIMIEIGDFIEKAMNSLDQKAKTSDEVGQVESDKNLNGIDNEPTDYMPDDVDTELFSEFITECTDLISNAEEALLSLENDPDDMDAVGTVFRAFHTVKGTSAFMELNILADIGHHAETLLSRVRDGEIRYAGGYADLALQSLDMIKALVKRVEKSLSGEPLIKPDGYDELLVILKDPERNGISDKAAADDFPEIDKILVAQGKVNEKDIKQAESPRLGDILVAQEVVDRDEIERVAKNCHNENTPIGQAVVQSEAASVEDVAKALRAQQKKKTKNTVEASVRVSTERLDRLVDMVGELVIAHAMVAEDDLIVNSDHHELLKKVAHSSKIVRELQDISMTMRMIPLKSTFQKMVRLVRDVSHKLRKKVVLVTDGEDTEIDRNMADAIKDPLVHMIRNAVDHGIEMPDKRKSIGKDEVGTVKLSAYHSAGSVVVEIKDDGKGIDRDAIINKALEKGIITNGSSLSDKEVFNLIFEPGFSTAKEVTDVSGRGVGMDVVKKNIEAIRGSAEIQSEKGVGSVFQMKLPLTLAIIDGMVARVGNEIYVIPTSSIVTSLRPDSKSLSKVLNKGDMLLIQGSLIPLFRVSSLFDVSFDSDVTEESLVVVVEDRESRVGLVIDELVGRQQVVVKTLGESLQNICGISGGAIMPNGRVGLIIDVGGIIKLAGSNIN